MADPAHTDATGAADRYAQAAFELALDAGALDALEKDFATLEAAFVASADLRAAAASPLIAADDKARALTKVAGAIGLSPLGVKVVGVAARNGRADALRAVGAAYARRLAAHRGTQPVEIIAAAPLADAEQAQIVAALAKALGGKVEATVSIDPSLIGGFIARAGSRQFDASVKTKLEQMKLALKSA